MTTTFYVPSVISFPFCKTTNSVVDNVYTHEEGHQHAVEILDSLTADIEFPCEMEDGDHLDYMALEVH